MAKEMRRSCPPRDEQREQEESHDFEYESRDEDGQWWLRHSHHLFATRLRVSTALGREPEVELALL